MKNIKFNFGCEFCCYGAGRGEATCTIATAATGRQCSPAGDIFIHLIKMIVVPIDLHAGGGYRGC